MPKLILLKGLQASGKSTLARKMVKDSGYNSGRINRDDLRAMIFDSKWSKDREKTIIACEKALAKVLLEQGRSVIVDDTGFKADFWKDLYSDTCFDYSSETIFLDTPLEECIRRDKERGEKGLPCVGRNVIERTAMKNGLVDWGDRPIILVDVDGTISDNNGREKHLRGEKKDWDTYYSLLGNDLPYTHIFREIKSLEDTHTIVLVSGRPDQYLQPTLDWIERVTQPSPLFPELDVPKIRIDYTLFRQSGDKRPDDIIKPEILNFIPKSLVSRVYDDRPSVCRAWEKAGLNVIWVRGKDLEEF